MNLVYINDEVIDIDPKQVIALTIQKISIGDISGRFMNRTNQIKALNTERNNRIFGNANIVSSATTIPYNFLPCKLIQNGVTTINDGQCEVVSSGSGYSLVIYENFVSISSYLDGLTLKDLTWPTQAWDSAGIDSARTATSGFISGVMGWGYSTANIYTSDRFLPCYYYYSLVETILGLTGYTLSGSILSDNDYKELVCTPVTKFTYTEENAKYNTKESMSSSSVSSSFSVNGATSSVVTDVLEYGFNPSIVSVYMDIDVSIYFNSLTTFFGGGSASTFQIRIIGSIQGVIDTSNATSGGTNYAITYTKTNVLVGNGETISLQFRFNKDAGFPADSVSFDYGTSSTYWKSVWNTAVTRTAPEWSNLVNTTPLKDIVRDFLIRFNIIHKVENNTLYLKTFEEIATDTAGAVDWSSKRVKGIDDIDFKSSYGQVNNFDYSGDNNLGNGFFEIDSDTLPTSVSIFTSPFNSALKWEGSGYDVMNIPAYVSTSSAIGDLDTEVPLTLGTLKARTSEAAITFHISSRTDYKLIYFLDSELSKDTSFQYFVDNYYGTMAISLAKNKVITRKYLLSEIDIAAYDPHKMIWDDGYFIVNKILNYVSGRVTTVELFKIG